MLNKRAPKFKALLIAGLLAALIGFISATEQGTHPYTLNYNPKLGKPNLPYNNLLTFEGVKLGRLLFYDTLLSGNNRQSCGSCHIQKYSFTDGKVLAIGAKGDTIDKNTMTLVNMAWNNRFFWDGRSRFLEDVMLQPITNAKEMGQDTATLMRELKTHPYYPALFARAFPGQAITPTLVSKALSQFVRTIISKGVQLPDSIFNQAQYSYTDSIQLINQYRNELSLRGSFYRFAFMCSPCHGGNNYGGIHMADNMIDSSHQFKAPTLINAALTAPYMHDGRFKNIEEVLQHYDKHIAQLHLQNPGLLLQPIKNEIKEYDKRAFARVLELFTDTSVINNPALGNPFTEREFSWSQQ